MIYPGVHKSSPMVKYFQKGNTLTLTLGSINELFFVYFFFFFTQFSLLPLFGLATARILNN